MAPSLVKVPGAGGRPTLENKVLGMCVYASTPLCVRNLMDAHKKFKVGVHVLNRRQHMQPVRACVYLGKASHICAVASSSSFFLSV